MHRKFKVIPKTRTDFLNLLTSSTEVLDDTQSDHPPVLRELSNADIFNDNPDDSAIIFRDNVNMFLTIASIEEIWVDTDRPSSGVNMAIFTSRPELLVYRLGLISPYMIDIKNGVVLIRTSNAAMILNWLERARTACLSFPAEKITELVYLDYQYYHVDELSTKVSHRSQSIHITTFMQMYRLDASSFSKQMWELYKEGIEHPIYVRGTYVTGLTSILRAFLSGEQWLCVTFLYPR